MCRNMVNGVEFDQFSDKVDGIVRLYNHNGEHVASLLPCDTDGADLALPSGKVLYCGVDYGLMGELAELLGLDSWETLK